MDSDALHPKVIEIANELTKIDPGSNWEIPKENEEKNNYFSIRNQNNQVESIYINSTWNGKGKLYIGGCFPMINNRMPYVKEHPSIGVSETKPPATIARDIINRLMSDYRRILQEVLERASENSYHQKKRIELAIQLSDKLGSKWEPHNNFNMAEGTPEAEIPYSKYPSLVHSFSMKVNSEKSVDLRVNIENPKIALQIAGAIKNILDENSEPQKPIDKLTIRKVVSMSAHIPHEDLVNFVVTNWDEEHMGPMPTSDDKAVVAFIEFYKDGINSLQKKS